MITACVPFAKISEANSLIVQDKSVTVNVVKILSSMTFLCKQWHEASGTYHLIVVLYFTNGEFSRAVFL